MGNEDETKLKVKGSDIASLITGFLILVAILVFYCLVISYNAPLVAMLYVCVYVLPIGTISFFIGFCICINLVVKKTERPLWFRISLFALTVVYSLIFAALIMYFIIPIIKMIA